MLWMVLVVSFTGAAGLLLLCALSWFTRKSVRHVVKEIKFEMIYNLLGVMSLLEDRGLKDHNRKVDIPTARGKVAIVTGGARGIGVEVVKKLVKLDAHVIIACRNVTAGENLAKSIRDKGINSGSIKVLKLDLCSLESVREFAACVKEQHPKIHLLINNAGKMFGPYEESVDGYESQFAINYLGHFLLTHLLFPQIKAAGEDKQHARVVNVSSCAHLAGYINFEDINFKKEFITSAAYSQSKLAQILFSNYLTQLLKEDKIPVSLYSVHPGIVDTDLFNGTIMKAITPSFVIRRFFKRPSEGATSILYACLSPYLEGKGGQYISNCHSIQALDSAYSIDLQHKTFNFTKSLLGIEEFGKAE